VAVNVTEPFLQIVVGVVAGVVAADSATAGVNAGFTVIAIPVACVAVLDVTHVKPVVIIMLNTSPVAIEPAAAV
jgi:hypothetical protein